MSARQGRRERCHSPYLCCSWFSSRFGFSCLASGRQSVKGSGGGPGLLLPLTLSRPPQSSALWSSPFPIPRVLPFSLRFSYFTALLFAAPEPDSSFPGPLYPFPVS